MADVVQGSYQTLSSASANTHFWKEKQMQLDADAVGVVQNVWGGACGPVGVSRPTFWGPGGPSYILVPCCRAPCGAACHRRCFPRPDLLRRLMF